MFPSCLGPGLAESAASSCEVNYYINVKYVEFLGLKVFFNIFTKLQSYTEYTQNKNNNE